MKKTLFIFLKIFLFLVWCIGGLISLTEIKLTGFNIGSWKVSSDEAKMFVTTAGDYLFWIWVVIGGFLFFKKRITK